MVNFKCCGSNGYSDYVTGLRVPSAYCCDSGIVCTPFNAHEGCKKKFIETMSGNTDNAKYFGLGLIAVELVGFIFGCCLANNIRNEKRRNPYN
ncbi:hypothetical protein DOY81_012985 [Sarcophaga bullata]|nr:hypothetical protein DOY81_012985 [Sarcophaga bullata]